MLKIAVFVVLVPLFLNTLYNVTMNIYIISSFSHKRLMNFIHYCLNETVFEGDKLIMKRSVIDHMKDIDDQSNLKGIRAKLTKLTNLYKAEKDNMSKIVNDDKSSAVDELNACRTWFQSSVCKEVENEHNEIWKKALQENTIEEAAFNKYAKYTLFEQSISDKCRPSVYLAIKVKDYLDKKNVYLPEGFDGDSYQELPEGWNLYKAKEPGDEPSCYEIRKDFKHMLILNCL